MPSESEIIKKRQQDKLKQQRAFETSGNEQKLDEQDTALAGFNMKPVEIEQAQIFIGDKCVQYDKPLIIGNPQTNVWCVRGEQKEVDAEKTKFMKDQKQSMEELLQLIQKNEPAQPEKKEEEPKVEEPAEK